MLLGAILVAASALTGGTPGASDAIPLGDRGWIWPVESFRIHRPFASPPHEYGPGHRGIDLTPVGGDLVRAPADGVVAFAGSVAGRPIVTIDHGDGLVTTLEPVTAVISQGVPVLRGTELGSVSLGGHADATTLHFGVRLHGDYINPMLLLGGVPRAVLLPCC